MNKAQVLSPILPLLMRSPPYLTKLPYLVALTTIRRHFRIQGLRAEPRNSFVSNNLVLLLSDLDISLWSEKIESIDKTKIKRSIELYKRFFPWIGEFQLYILEDLPYLASVANYYEAQRDPILFGYMEGHLQQGPYEAAVYLARMLESDAKQIKTQFKFRQKKWLYHLGQVNPSQDIKKIDDIEQLISLIIQCFPKNFTNNIVNAYFKGRIENEPDFDSKIDFIFRPQCQLDRFKDFDDLSQEERQLLEANLKWECFGLYTQLYLANDQVAYLKHLALLHQFASHYHFDNVIKFTDFLIERSARVHHY